MHVGRPISATWSQPHHLADYQVQHYITDHWARWRIKDCNTCGPKLWPVSDLLAVATSRLGDCEGPLRRSVRSVFKSEIWERYEELWTAYTPGPGRPTIFFLKRLP